MPSPRGGLRLPHHPPHVGAFFAADFVSSRREDLTLTWQ